MLGSPPPDRKSASPAQRSYPAIVVEMWAWARGRRRRFVIGGRSMLPTLEPGWFVLMDPTGVPVEGQVVVARHPEKSSTVVVKRVERVLADSALWVLSDNANAGNDSRHFGPIGADAVVGVVTLVLDHPRRGVHRGA